MPTSITFDGLMKAAAECSRGVKWKDSIAHWVHPRSMAINCLKLLGELERGTYRLGGYVTFQVTEPKVRTIRSPKFRDRVVQRAMCNDTLYDDLTRDNIHDNGACQKGKGTTFTMDRLSCHLQRHWRRHGKEGWVLRLDIHKFFDSIPHDRLKAMARRKIRNGEYADLVCEIIDSFDDPGIGLGSQVSQLLAISYLSGLDHYIKEGLGISAYVRYSDDMVLIHRDRGVLLKAWSEIGDRLSSLGLSLNPKSTLHPLSQGIDFLKFRYVLTDTGRVVRILNRKSGTRIRRRISRLASKALAGERSWDDVENSFVSWKSHAEHGNSHNRIRRMERWLKSLEVRKS